jgi:hypothetical protein
LKFDKQNIGNRRFPRPGQPTEEYSLPAYAVVENCGVAPGHIRVCEPSREVAPFIYNRNESFAVPGGNFASTS